MAPSETLGLLRAVTRSMAIWNGNSGVGWALAAILFTHSLFAADAASSSGQAPETSASVVNVGDLNSYSVAAIATATTNPLLIEPIIPGKPSRSFRFEQVGPSRRGTKIWIALAVSQHSAALFDAWSTRRAVGNGGGYESDPLLSPFAGSAAMYPATQVLPTALDFISHRMMKSHNRYLRRGWWLPQAASIAGSVWCGSHNLQVANVRR